MCLLEMRGQVSMLVCHFYTNTENNYQIYRRLRFQRYKVENLIAMVKLFDDRHSQTKNGIRFMLLCVLTQQGRTIQTYKNM